MIKAQFEQLENEMKDSNANFEAMKKGFLELTELKHILRKTQVFFEEVSTVHPKGFYDIHVHIQIPYTTYMVYVV